MNVGTATRDRFVAGALASLFAASLFVPALEYPGRGDSPFAPEGPISGIKCLAALPFVAFVPNWWANPLFLVGIIRLSQGNGRAPLWVGKTAVVLAITAPWVVGKPLVQWLHGSRFVTFPLRSGYFAWLSAIVGLAAYSWFADRTAIPPSPPSDR